MKKLSFLLSSIFLFCLISAAGAQQFNAGLGLGINTPDAPDQTGFNSKAFGEYAVNKYFAIGLETGFDMLKKDKGKKVKVGDAELTTAEDTDFYTIPALLTLRLSFPVGEYNSPLKPYILGGLGYSWTRTNCTGKNETFNGLTYQALGGITYDLGYDAANMNIFLEAGWRWTDIEASIERENLELDMSGFLARIGVSFPLGAKN